jgi:hypothetical protein
MFGILPKTPLRPGARSVRYASQHEFVLIDEEDLSQAHRGDVGHFRTF